MSYACHVVEIAPTASDVAEIAPTSPGSQECGIAQLQWTPLVLRPRVAMPLPAGM